MNLEVYKSKTKELEALLKKLTEKGKLSEIELSKLDTISEYIAEFEETNFPFKPDNLKEMIELRMNFALNI